MIVKNISKAISIELPRTRWNIEQIAAYSSISWERRERWAVQVVQGISQIHAHSFVVGGLTTYTWPLIEIQIP